MQAGEFGSVGAAGQPPRVAVDLFVELAERAVGGAEPQVVVVGGEPVALGGGDVARGQRRPQPRDLALHLPSPAPRSRRGTRRSACRKAAGWQRVRGRSPGRGCLVRSSASAASAWASAAAGDLRRPVMSGRAATVLIGCASIVAPAAAAAPADERPEGDRARRRRSGARAERAFTARTRPRLTGAKLGTAGRPRCYNARYRIQESHDHHNWGTECPHELTTPSRGSEPRRGMGGTRRATGPGRPRLRRTN